MKSFQLSIAIIAISITFVSSVWTKFEQISAFTRISKNEDYILPHNIIPVHYDIKLIPHLESDATISDGEVDIDIIILEPTNTITLHVDELEIGNINVKSANANHPITRTTEHSVMQFYTLIFTSALTPGSYLIHIEYTFRIRNDLLGFYKSYYKTNTGEKRWYASTFFAPTFARCVFPSFDEPALKATFTISIAHSPTQIAISNALTDTETVVQTNLSIGNRVWTKFQMTPLMSTYLVAFAVFDFECLANDDNSLRTWSRPEALQAANFSLSGVALLNELNTFIGIDYNSTLGKMDQIALPISTAVAMENWGLITYRESWILWYEGISTTRDKQNIATTIAHEFSHQWFGNLVSPEWWKYIWLSEGVATFFEYYTTAQVYPSWRLMEQFTVEMCHSVLLIDSSDISRPMNADVYSPSEINSVFDKINYNKGACLVRMLLHLVGESVFRTGLQIYQKKNIYRTGTPDKLWAALTEADEEATDSILNQHVDIKTVMDTWTNQKGYPLVTVDRNYTFNLAVISQEPFLLGGRKSINYDTEYRWWIPLNFAIQTSLNFTTVSQRWLRAQDESVMISGFWSNHWVIFNGQQAGFYRVNYDERNWNMIAEYLLTANFINIPPLTRAQLIDDAFNLARAGYIKYTIAFDLSRYLRQETDYIPWAAAFNSFAYLNTMLAKSSGYSNFQTYIFSRVAPIHNSLGYAVQDDDQHVTTFLRENSHSWACRMRCPGCNSQVQQFMQNFYNSEGNSSIPVDLKKWVYCEGLRNASVDVWNFMWNRYLATDVAGEQSLILSGLGCSLNEDILNRYLTFSITKNSGLRFYHKQAVFNSVYLSSPSNVEIALTFLLTNDNEVSASYGGFSVVSDLMEDLSYHLISESHLSLLRAYITQQRIGKIASAARHALKIAEENIAWLDTYENDIMQWLAKEVNSANNLLATFSPILLICVYAILNFIR